MAATAFVLAAGFGTRLRPLTDTCPKPLVPVCGVPMLAYALALCARHGLSEVIVNAHYLAERLRPWAGEHEGVRVWLSEEHPEILGTGGGLRQVRDRLAERFVVVNGDVLCDVDLTALKDKVVEGGGSMALRPSDEAERYGIVAADATGTVVKLASVVETEPVGAVVTDTHFSGIHALDRRTLERVPDGFGCIVRTAYRELVPTRQVQSIRHHGTWLDVGDPPSYLAANLDVLGGRVATPLDPFERAGFSVQADGRRCGDERLIEGAHVSGPVWIGAGARIGAGSRLRECVVGAGAVVPPGTELDRVVVWEDRRVAHRSLRGAVVHDTGGLELG